MAEGKALLMGLASKVPLPGKKPGGGAAKAKTSDDDMMGLEAAMGDLGKALKSGDNAAAAMAFKEAKEICESLYGDK